MKQIETREDIFKLVSNFYQLIRKDDLLGPIFNMHLSNDQWPKHIEKLTDFWVTTLLGQACFKGNPSKAHITVDAGMKHTMEQVHFGTWLQLWFTTIDSLYEGDLAQRAKDSARKMSTGLYLNVFKNRP